MIKRLVLPFFIFFVLAYPIFAQMPSIGAQVFIEPGQTEKEITHWFEVLKKNGFTSCRIRMFESYMRDSKGNYDFSLFDIAFDAAKANGIKVFATIFPDTPFEDVGGIKLPKDSIHQEEIASYISHLVNHYKDHPALFAWVLINEPGLGSLPQSDYVSKALSMWQDTVQQSQLKKHEYRQVQFENQRFLMDLNTSFLSWVAKEIKKYDKKTHLHVNNHQIFQLADEYDFPSWMTFLNSLGASIHPSWHFGFFDRVDYTLAAAANCDMIASGAGKKPFWVTELQGGSNIFSGVKPISPSYEEITQWLWSSIGSGAEVIIFWSLNPRAVGIEAGEWALLNNLNRNSKRMDAAAQVANTLNNHQAFFAQAKSVKPKVNVLYTHQSMWAEKYLHMGPSKLEARNIGASIKSALSFYQAFQEIGISVSLGEMNEYDWNRVDYKGEILVLANQFAISEENWDLLKSFVAKGGFLFLEGL
ncbi:MAG: beta-galactosidase, partial [Cyclobacteriaceae bacterium]